jgi:hypothetical protein
MVPFEESGGAGKSFLLSLKRNSLLHTHFEETET